MKFVKDRRFEHSFRVTALILVILVAVSPGCKKLVEVGGPSYALDDDAIYKTDEAAISVLNGIYGKMASGSLSSGGSVNTFMPVFASLAGDEYSLMPNASATYNTYYQNNLSSIISPDIWQATYQYMYTVNAAIEGLTRTETVTPAVRRQLLGEARFLRGFFYYYLVNLYGDVPLVLGTDYRKNSLLPRTSMDVVLQQILTDLLSSDSLLTSAYMDIHLAAPTSSRTAPIKWAAKALLARVYLMLNNFAKAEEAASAVIDQTDLYELPAPGEVFKSGSREVIWQLQPVNIGWNTEEARFFILPRTGPRSTNPVYLSHRLLDAFEFSDLRRGIWIDSVKLGSGSVFYYPAKYKVATLNAPVTEYSVVLRLAEQYLIRAEARAKQQDLSEAIADLDQVRHRAGLPGYNGALELGPLIQAIIHERQVELFSEWGHRWLDMKRLGIIDSVMSVAAPQKGGVWKSRSQYFPLRAYELQYNPSLVQTPGY